jgi:hypothetical protein
MQPVRKKDSHEKKEIDFGGLITREEVQELAMKTNFVKRISGKIDPYEFLLTLVFRTVTSVPVGLGILTSFLNLLVSREALHQRFNKRTEKFFGACLALILSKRLLSGSQIETGLMGMFSEILIIDSSSWKISEKLEWIFPGCGGSGGKAGCKLQFCYDYLTGEFQLLDAMEGKLPDQKYTRNLPAIMSKGALVIFDLGYWAFDTLFDILQKGSFFLSRLNTRVQLWEKNGDTYTAVDLVKTLKNCTEQGIEVELYLNKGDKFIKVRLVGYRVPEETANIRRMKARRNSQKKGHTASERTLFHCNWSLFITNADTEKLPGKMLRTLYRLRWNVELIFKSWKSILRMHKTNVRKNDHRIKCELYAKLILATIVHRIHHHLNSYMWNSLKRELSLDKLWKYIQVRIETLYKKMLQGSDEFTAYINSLLENIIVVCEKKHQKKRKTTLQLIDEMIGDAQPLKKGIELKYLEKFKLA